MVWIHAVAEGPSTTVMNPTTDEKLRRAARHVGLGPGDQVLDVGAGRCHPALLFAREFGCRITALEPYEPFLDDARRLVTAAGMSDRFTFVRSAGADFVIESEGYDAAMCLGATWAWGDLDGTLDALRSGVRSGGHVIAGEPYRKTPEAKKGYGSHDWTLSEIIARFEMRGLAVISVVRSSVDDWDDYSSVRVRNFLDWIAEHPDHEDVEQVREWRREHARDIGTHDLGWVIVSGRKTNDA